MTESVAMVHVPGGATVRQVWLGGFPLLAPEAEHPAVITFDGSCMTITPDPYATGKPWTADDLNAAFAAPFGGRTARRADRAYRRAMRKPRGLRRHIRKLKAGAR